jgi:TolA-binding protein
MTRTRESPEDLVVRARRCELSDEEQRRLDLALEASQELRLLLEAGTGFDAESSVLPGDDALVAQAGRRAAARASARPRRRGALLVTAGMFVATAAAAGGWAVGRASSPARPAPSATAPEARATLSGPPVRASVDVAVAAASTETEADPAPVGSAVAKIPTRATDGPGELFAEASRARRRGQTARAMGLYRALVARYPASVEAQQAELTLGELSLTRGDPAVALECFRRYRDAPLASEALWGEARALRQLGRQGEERQALEKLLERYPGSTYAEAARKRLADGSR